MTAMRSPRQRNRSLLRDDEFVNSLLRFSIQMMDECSPLDSELASGVRGIGHQLGIELARLLVSSSRTSVYSFIEALSVYWKRNEIGNISWQSKKRRLISIDCPESRTNKLVTAGCAHRSFREGLLKGVLEEKIGKAFDVEEVMCGLARNRGCLFKMSESS